jgi:hypothetical protein
VRRETTATAANITASGRLAMAIIAYPRSVSTAADSGDLPDWAGRVSVT